MWKVSAGSASGLLLPGTEATMPYSVQNVTGTTQRLHGIVTAVKPEGAGGGCLASWFRVASNSIASDLDVPSGATVAGTLALAFDEARVPQDACQNVDLQVVVTAR